jgi:alkylated DNA nucleotide flippase Atl1
VPCFRVVCSDGRVGGYKGRENSREKSLLLKKEGIQVKKGKVSLENCLWRPV